MQALDIVIEDNRWQATDFASLCTQSLIAALTHLNVPTDVAEISILACDDARIASLNADFRGKPTPTNVLSWPAEERAATTPGGQPQPPIPDPDGTLPLGDIAISFDTCAAQATAADKPLADHTTHLIIHGLLHLLGYDHVNDADAALMERLETAILATMGLADPYEI